LCVKLIKGNEFIFVSVFRRKRTFTIYKQNEYITLIKQPVKPCWLNSVSYILVTLYNKVSLVNISEQHELIINCTFIAYLSKISVRKWKCWEF